MFGSPINAARLAPETAEFLRGYALTNRAETTLAPITTAPAETAQPVSIGELRSTVIPVAVKPAPAPVDMAEVRAPEQTVTHYTIGGAIQSIERAGVPSGLVYLFGGMAALVLISRRI